MMESLLAAQLNSEIVWAAPVLAYLVGATPFAWIIARLNGVDLQSVGSGNIGATNVTRAIGKPFGYLCFVLDMGKGLAPVLAMHHWVIPADGLPTSLQQGVWLGTGVAAIVGHVFPFWLKFRGGKGVATSLGVVLGVYPYFTVPGLAAFAVWVAATLISRYVSLGSILAAVAFVPLFLAWSAFRVGPNRVGKLWPMICFAALVVGLILIRHRANLARLRAGTENRIGDRRAVASDSGEDDVDRSDGAQA